MDDADRAQENIERAMRVFERRKPDALRPSKLGNECADCGDLIALARLKIFPYAMRCAECQNYSDLSNGR